MSQFSKLALLAVFVLFFAACSKEGHPRQIAELPQPLRTTTTAALTPTPSVTPIPTATQQAVEKLPSDAIAWIAGLEEIVYLYGYDQRTTFVSPTGGNFRVVSEIPIVLHYRLMVEGSPWLATFIDVQREYPMKNSLDLPVGYEVWAETLNLEECILIGKEAIGFQPVCEQPLVFHMKYSGYPVPVNEGESVSFQYRELGQSTWYQLTFTGRFATLNKSGPSQFFEIRLAPKEVSN